MVYIIVEHLLSSSSNRLLYETLWNLGLNKKSANRNFDNLSITTICNDLIQEIKRNDADRSKFYFTTQICFGAVLVYRNQIDKLYGQAKIALQACKVTCYDINWLSQLAREVSQTLPEETANSKKGVNAKKSKGKQVQKKPIDDLDLIEQAFNIPDAKIDHVKKSRGNKSTNDETGRDPTMASSSMQITMMDTRRDAPMDLTNDDFGQIAQDEFDISFHLPDNQIPAPTAAENITDQEVPQHPENIVKEVQEDYHTLLDDVMDIVNQQLPVRKRRGSTEKDISDRIDGFKRMRISECDDNNINNVSPFDNTANVPEAINQSPALHNSTFVIPRDDEKLIDEACQLTQSDLSPIRDVTKKRKKPKLIIDKQIKIKDEVLKKEAANYSLKFKVPSPLDTFQERFDSLKNSVDSMFLKPASRIKVLSNELFPAFQRGCKRISQKILKRSLETTEEEERAVSPPVKRRSLRHVPEISYDESAPVPLKENPLIEDREIVPLNFLSEELNLLELEPIEIQQEHNQIQDDISNAIMLNEPQDKARRSDHVLKQVYGENDEYRELDKWSKQDIMETLNGTWSDQKKEPITMKKLSRKTNRFVAAGIFFELMVLSKAGAIELVQGDGLEIEDILPGANADIYI